jgi:hypothetical protein
MLVKQPYVQADIRSVTLATGEAPAVGVVDGWPTIRPGLAYQWALDLAARAGWQMPGQRVVLSDHPSLGHEAARRLGAPWFTQPHASDDGDLTSLSSSILTIGLARVGAVGRGHGQGDGVGTVLWIEPTYDTWPITLAGLPEVLHEDGQLLVLTTSPWLGRNLSERQLPGAAPSASLLSSRAVASELLKAGWSNLSVLGFRGVRALSLGVLERLASRIGRPALADRLGVSMRACYLERGALAHLSTVTLLTAQPPGWVAEHREATR